MYPEPANRMLKFRDFNPINKGTIDSMNDVKKIRTSDNLDIIKKSIYDDDFEYKYDIEDIDNDRDITSQPLKIDSGPANLKKHTSHPYGFWDAPYTHMGNYLESFEDYDGKSIIEIDISSKVFLNKLKLKFVWDSEIVNIINTLKNIEHVKSKRLNKSFYKIKITPLTPDYFMMNKNKIKVGRLIKILIPNILDKSIENFVNKFKAFHEKTYGNLKVKIFSGEKIKKYYRKECSVKTGALTDSCMVNQPSSWFDFYVKNQNISLAVLMCGEKMLARALIFNTNNNFVMERVYANEYQYIDYMRSWGLESGLKIKKSNILNEKKLIDNKNNIYDVRDFHINLNSVEFDNYPYLDTFNLLDMDKKILTSIDYKGGLSKNLRLLTSDDGKYVKLQ